MARHRPIRTAAIAAIALNVAFVAAQSSCVVAQDLGSTGDTSSPIEGGAHDGADVTEPDRPPPADVGPSETNDAAPEASSRRDAGPNGPGPFGALPSGYCCTDDSECRFRQCAAVDGGARMCLDQCSPERPFICTRPDIDFACVPNGAGYRCEPPPAAGCIDPSTFSRGTKTTGSCCGVSDDGLMGHECEANLCIATGANPWVCTRRCTSGGDCPSGYQCVPVGDRKECVSTFSPYTCSP